MKEFVEKLIERLEEKIKVTSLEIIVTGTKDKPYFEIKYKEVGKEDYNIGYSSYELDNVFSWKEECFEIVNQLAEEFAPDINVGSKNQGWIPCSKRLPEVFDNVLISTIEGGRTIGHRCPNQAFGRFYDLHSFAIDNVIAWQPLPSPYKPEEKPEKPQTNFYSERFNRVI